MTKCPYCFGEGTHCSYCYGTGKDPLSGTVERFQKIIEQYTPVTKSLEKYLRQTEILTEQSRRTICPYQEIMSNTLKRAEEVYSQTVGLHTGVKHLTEGFPSPALQAVEIANQSIEKIAAKHNLLEDVIQQGSSVHDAWKEQVKSLQSIFDVHQLSDVILGPHLVKLSEISMLAEVSLANISWENIGSALKLETQTKYAVQKRFLEFTASYADLFQSYESQSTNITNVPPEACDIPPIEFFNATELLNSITDPKEELEETGGQVGVKLRLETEDALSSLISKLNNDLLKLLDGARQALVSDNPEKGRHFAISLRELFTHILHDLAPDTKVRAWTENPKYFSNRKPTRKARLLYICRDINHGPFSDFIQKDIDAVLEFLNLFQRGTHKVIISYTDAQLLAMHIRMESAIRFLLEIWKYSK